MSPNCNKGRHYIITRFIPSPHYLLVLTYLDSLFADTTTYVKYRKGKLIERSIASAMLDNQTASAMLDNQTLFRNKRFMLNLMLYRHASKFAIF